MTKILILNYYAELQNVHSFLESYSVTYQSQHKPDMVGHNTNPSTGRLTKRIKTLRKPLTKYDIWGQEFQEIVSQIV